MLLFGLKLAGPPNLRDNDQERPASYVLDVTENGNWLCQRDYWGRIASKPPVYTWLSAIVTLLVGKITLFSLYLPGALAAAGTACLIFWAGKIFFNERAAWLGAMMHLLTGSTLKQLTLARTDGVFMFFVAASALAGWLGWKGRISWVWFWLLAAAATLTKGPLGVVFAAGGLLSAFWKDNELPRIEKQTGHLAGIMLYIILSGGWLALAYAQYGDPVLDKLFRKELVGHIVTAKKSAFPGSEFYQPPLFFLGRYAPWSILAVMGLWRVWKRPATDVRERQFERYVFWWFTFGLALLSISTHQRADLLWPLYPAAALLAGREAARLTISWNGRKLTYAVAGCTVLVLALLSVVRPGNSRTVQETVALRNFAGEVRDTFGANIPFQYVDAPFTLQFYLNTMQRHISVGEANQLLRGQDRVFVALSGDTNISRQITGHTVRTVQAGNGTVLRLVSNETNAFLSR